MVHNNKVLTVSYGTFSCTLEGFEDSFDTMKAIAEYFRDLAADDRYFGAEPPQPDAEMLARIAQREVARQVEAHTSDQGIHLRTATALAPAAAPEPVTEPATAKAEAPATEPVAAEDNPAETPDAPVAEADAPTAEVPSIEEASDDVEVFEVEASEEKAEVAAKVVTAEAAEGIPAEGSDAEAAAWGVDAALVDASTASEEDHIIVPEAEPEPTPVSESIAAKLQRIRAVVAKTPPREEEFSEDQHADGFSSGNSYLDEVVKDLETAGDDGAEATDDPVTAEVEEATAADISDILDQLEAHTAEADTVVETETTEPAEEDLDAALNAVTAAVEAEAEHVAAQKEAAEETPTNEDTSALIAQAITDAPTANAPEDASDAPVPEAAQDVKSEATEEPQPEPATEAPAKEAPRRARGRVIRVRRAAASKTLVDATAEDVTPEPSQRAEAPAAEAEPQHMETTPEVTVDAKMEGTKSETPKAAPAPQSSLSDDDEADLMAELAAVEAELMASSRPAETATASALDDNLSTSSTDTTNEAEGFAQETVGLEEATEFEEPEQSPPSSAASLLQRSPGALEGDLSRLMAEADDKLEQADAASSRETYNQLRAAVAAAQAEGGTLDDRAEKDAQAQAYRQDLDSVVRPRRARSDAKGAPGRGAPLKLVAEQRIDPEATATHEAAVQAPAPEEVAVSEPAATKVRPVRPRRVSSAILNRTNTGSADTQDTGFSDYVRQQGAVELGELLEAAATYMTKVEGRDQFTRPQLLGKVRGLDDQGGLTREDSLRAFGQLLRDGKLERSSNGRFTTNELTGFGDDRATG